MLRTRLFPIGLCMLLAGATATRADALSDLAKYSVFSQVDLSALAKGKIVTSRGPSLNFSRDLSVQAVYLVHAPVARALELHKSWDASKHSQLKVLIHRDLPAHPSPADFSFSPPDDSAVGKLAGATEKLPGMGDLQLSKSEAAMFKGGGGGDFPPAVRDFWAQILFSRDSAFLQRGLSGLPPYDSADGSVRVGDEFNRLLREQPRIRAAFAPVIGRSPLGGGTGSLPLSPYCELFDEEGQGAFSLGADCSVQAADTAQMLELQYYASGGYYAYVTFYQMWPVSVAGQAATLVWRVDAISSLSFSDLGPFDRMGSGSAMMKDIERIITFFKRDTKS